MVVQASYPLGHDLPQFLLPKSLLLDRPLPKLEFHSPLSLPQLPPLTEARLCKEVTLQRHTQGHSGATALWAVRLNSTQGLPGVGGSASWTTRPWPRGPGQAHQLLPSLQAGVTAGWNSWTPLGSSLPVRLGLLGPCRMPPT